MVELLPGNFDVPNGDSVLISIIPANGHVIDSFVISEEVYKSGDTLFQSTGTTLIINSTSELSVYFGSNLKILSNPNSLTATDGDSISFYIIVSGTGPFTYQWQKNGINIDNANDPVYIISEVIYSDDHEAEFCCIVKKLTGLDTSENALLTITPIEPTVICMLNRKVNINDRLLITAECNDNKIIEKINNQDPLNIDSLMLLGKLNQKQNKLDEAMETYKQILFINKTHTPSRLEMGNIYLKQNKFENAKKQYKSVIKLSNYNFNAKNEDAIKLKKLTLNAYKGLSKVANTQKDYKKAMMYNKDISNLEIELIPYNQIKKRENE